MSADGRGVKLGVVILLGVLLIFLGSRLDRSTGTEVKTDEDRAAEMCSLMDGVGECRVMMTYYPDSDGERVYAVLVLCEGAESIEVREKITAALSSLYGIGSHRVEIQRLNP